MTFTSQELWGTNTQGVCYVVNPLAFYLFVAFFIALLSLVNITDYRKICENMIVVISCTVASIIIDLGVLYVSEYFLLLTIDQIATDLIKSISGILLVVLPWSLGEITLNSLTVEYLKKRAEKLLMEAKELRKQAESVKKRAEEGEESLKEFEKKKTEFKESLKDRKTTGEDSE